MSAAAVNTYGLPSTTAVGQRLPKEAFYRHLKLTSAQKREFVDLIEAITVAASVKEATVRVPPTPEVQEILLLEVGLRGSQVPETALAAVASQHPHRLLFACRESGENPSGGACCFALWRGGQLHCGPWGTVSDQTITLRGKDLGIMWDNLCSQVIFGDGDGVRVDERLQLRGRIAWLTKDLASVERRHAKEHQPAKRNELFAQKRALQRELAELEGRA